MNITDYCVVRGNLCEAIKSEVIIKLNQIKRYNIHSFIHSPCVFEVFQKQRKVSFTYKEGMWEKSHNLFVKRHKYIFLTDHYLTKHIQCHYVTVQQKTLQFKVCPHFKEIQMNSTSKDSSNPLPI